MHPIAEADRACCMVDLHRLILCAGSAQRIDDRPFLIADIDMHASFFYRREALIVCDRAI